MPAPLMMVSAHPMPISIATPSRDMTFTSTKGLLNGPGQNNCFLNSAVQVLWHLDIFRRSFRDLSGHACMADSCIFCALKELFSQLQFSNETALPPDALRRALAESFFDQQRFQLGFMDDAAECFENMLLRIHMHIAHGEAEDMCNARHCIPHQKFAMTLVEQSVCGSCGATSEPLSYTQMVHYVSTSTLVYQVRTNPTRQGIEPFGQLLRKAGGMGDVRVCPSACGAVIQIGRTLMNRPEIVSVGLVWNSERPTLEHIMEVFSTIGTTLRLGDVFNKVVDTRWAETCTHNLVGVVTYYGKHYSTFFFHTKLRVWIYFDDATVREVGPRWEQVVEKCRKGRYQPLLLLYASPDGTPVNTENAPKQVTPFYNENKPLNKKVAGPSATTHQSLSLMRRSITPSPEKPNLVNNNTRRAITPNPDSTQKPPLIPRPYNEYQNLSVIQSNLYNNNRGVDCVDSKEPEYVTKKDFGLNNNNKPNVHRTLSNGSSSGVETCFREYLNLPRTRDSGNWSSDRNSSSSSTTMENPYLYMVKNHDNPALLSAPVNPGGSVRAESSSSNGSGAYDVGYDSYSLSSNDSSTMTTIQHLMKMGHLAKIPEDYNNAQPPNPMVSCDVLCDEADELLVKSRQLEDDHDLVLALALCNAAATKARAAMDAPYNNPQTLTLARMKHNTCIMRARSLHRRMTQSQNPPTNCKDGTQPEIRHTREGSSGSGKHSRQSSRDKTGQHSRQNSRELLLVQPVEAKSLPHPTKSIEIYATLPKKKDGLKKIINIEEDDYALYDKPPGRESRSIFSRGNKNKEANKVREKRSRSEDRNKMTRDLSIAPEIIFGKDTLKKAKEDKEEKKEKDGKGKKQHKIRRKLLMGGLIRRKNRSMPDLTDANADKDQKPSATVDDSKVGLVNKENSASMCGYLSEGHLEFTGSSSTNPNLERSKLMRKSFHGSAGKILTAAKVPPPPPLRTSSQLSTSAKLIGGEGCEDNSGQRPITNNSTYYPYEMNHYGNYNGNHPQLAYSAPPLLPVRYNTPDSNMVVTKADVHQEQIPPRTELMYRRDGNDDREDEDPGVDEVDCLPSSSHLPVLDLPPYPSPLSSALHSRQASEEFPPPPPPLDLSALDEHLPQLKGSCPSPTPSPGSLLAQLQNKRQEILSQDVVRQTYDPPKSSGDTWLKELQAKQAALRMKKNQPCDDSNGGDYNFKKSNDDISKAPSSSSSSVKDLANKFENIQVQPLEVNSLNASVARSINLSHYQAPLESDAKRVPPEQIAEEIREVEMIQRSINTRTDAIEEAKKNNNKAGGKKKSVSFCDQVILVEATEEQEDDSYNRNPLLEKILKYASKDGAPPKQEIQTLKQPEAPSPQPEANYSPVPTSNNEEWVLNQQLPTPQQQQPVYATWRRNSVENLLSRQNSFASTTDSDGNNYLSDGHNPRQAIYGTSPQMNMQIMNRQSPYQRIPQNSPIYMYNNQTVKPPPNPHYPNNQINGGSVPSPQYGRPQQPPQVMRQSPQHYPVYQHPPSPAPVATVNLNHQNYQQNYSHSPQYQIRQPSPIYDNRGQYSPYQHPPVAVEPQQTYMQHTYPPYQQVPHQPHHNNMMNNNQMNQYNYSPPQEQMIMSNNGSLPRSPLDGGNYHRVPPPHGEVEYVQKSYPAYQHALPPKQLLKKTVSFEAGTKGGAESPIPKAVVTPIIVNNSNSTVPTCKTKCNLCRKKAVVSSNLYCTDCEFYMSRFKPKR